MEAASVEVRKFLRAVMPPRLVWALLPLLVACSFCLDFENSFDKSSGPTRRQRAATMDATSISSLLVRVFSTIALTWQPV